MILAKTVAVFHVSCGENAAQHKRRNDYRLSPAGNATPQILPEAPAPATSLLPVRLCNLFNGKTPIEYFFGNSGAEHAHCNDPERRVKLRAMIFTEMNANSA